MKKETFSDTFASTGGSLQFLNRLLTRAENPAQINQLLVDELLSLTDSRCVLLIQNIPGNTFRIAGLSPRQQPWVESPAVLDFCKMVSGQTEDHRWKLADLPVISDFFQKEGQNIVRSFALKIGQDISGAIVLFGLPPEENDARGIEMIAALAPTFALIIRNSFLFENQGKILQDRSAELLTINQQLKVELETRKQTEKALRESKDAVGQMLEESERARKLLLSILEDGKMVEEQLKVTKEYLENLLDSASVPIIVWDNKFRITQFNKAFERLSGRSGAEMLGKDPWILFPPATRKQSLEQIEKTVAGNQLEAVEIDIQHVGGAVHTVLWNSAAVYSAETGEILATIAQGQDITERIQAERQIVRFNEELEQLVQQRTAELNETIAELEEQTRVFVGRELRVIELKERVEELEQQLKREGL